MVVAFLKELWQNIFESGTTPALVKATHMSFLGLVVTIVIMFYFTHSLHFVALFFLSLCLWAAVTWFITAYNEFLAQQEKEKKEEPSSETEKPNSEEQNTEKQHAVKQAVENSATKAGRKTTKAKKRRV